MSLRWCDSWRMLDFSHYLIDFLEDVQHDWIFAHVSKAIVLSSGDVEHAKTFAREISQQKRTIYQERNGEAHPRKIEHDFFIGACGELGIYRMLLPRHPSLQPPDFTIRTCGKFKADLVADSFTMGVKSCQAQHDSWIYQVDGDAIRHGCHAFVKVHEIRQEIGVDLAGWLSTAEVIMRLKRTHKTMKGKRAIYEIDIPLSRRQSKVRRDDYQNLHAF